MEEEKEIHSPYAGLYLLLKNFGFPVFIALLFVGHFLVVYLPAHEEDMRHQIEVCRDHILEMEKKLDRLLERKNP